MNTTETNRLNYLDAVRGLAALSVLMFHTISSRWGDKLIGKWGMVLFNGGAAVTMFFVLSGFVLSYKYFQDSTPITPTLYKRFVVARLFRLYPAFWVMLLVYYVNAHWTEQSVGFWVQTIVKNPHNFWEEALLIRGYHTLFFPDWTLGLELAISLFVPFLILLLRHDQTLFQYFLVAVFVANRDYINSNFIAFGLGMLMANNMSAITGFSDKKRWWYRWRWALLPVVFAAYNLHQILRISPAGPTYTYFTSNFLIIDEALVSAFAAAAMLLWCIHSDKLKQVLRAAPLLFLGKISYGLYLAHWFVIPLFNKHADAVMEYLGQSHWQYFGLLTLFTISLSCLMGTALYYGVEKPFIRLGKKRIK